jgi:hypothetical protein
MRADVGPHVYLCHLIENWLPVLMSFILYALLLIGQFALATASQRKFEGDHRFLIRGVSFVIGATIMLGSCSLVEKFGYTRKNIAYYTLGLPACLCLLLVAWGGMVPMAAVLETADTAATPTVAPIDVQKQSLRV